MANHASFIPKLNDRDVISAFRRAAEEVRGDVTVSFSGQFGAIPEAQVDAYKKARGRALTIAVIKSAPFQWNWSRIDANENLSIPQAAEYDRLTFHSPDNQRIGSDSYQLAY